MAVQLRAPSRAVLAARPVRAARSVSFAAVAKAVRAPPPPAAASSRRGRRPGALRPRWAQPRRPFAAAPRRGGPKRGASAAQQAALARGAPSAVPQPRFDARCAGHRRATPWTRCAASSASSWAWTWTRCGGAAASLCPSLGKHFISVRFRQVTAASKFVDLGADSLDTGAQPRAPPPRGATGAARRPLREHAEDQTLCSFLLGRDAQRRRPAPRCRRAAAPRRLLCPAAPATADYRRAWRRDQRSAL